MLSVGDIVGGTYRIDRLLGQGGMARVFLVSHTRVEGKKFALKLISQPGASDAFLQRFRREADVLGKLSHPHIVNIVDFNQTPDGMPYLVMEYLEGEDLSQFLERVGVLQKEVALSIVYQTGQALQSAHDAGVVHRDLKPANLFICKNAAFPNYIKVLDFGIAKILNDNGLTSDRSLMGTPSYMSPEQARGMARQIDHRSDQFSLAVILYELLSGKRPFCPAPGADPIAILAQIVSADPPSLPFPGIWPALERALRKNAQERFPSIHDFVEATGARRAFGAMAKSPTMGTNTNGEVDPVGDKPRLRGRTLLGGGIVAALAVGTVVVWQSAHTQRVDHVVTTGTHPAMAAPATAIPLPHAPNEAPKPAPAKSVEKLVADGADNLRPGIQSATRPKSAGDEGEEVAVAKHRPTAARRALNNLDSSDTKLSQGEQPKATSTASATSGFTVLVSGANVEQSLLIKQCANKELKALSGLPKTYKVTMQRSGTLHIIDSPSQIFHTDLAQCLRNQFKGRPVPESVVLTIRGSR